MNSRLVGVWDWNGTLVDDSFVFVEIMNEYLSSYGLKKISLKDYQNNFCFPVSQYYKQLGFNLSKKEFEFLSADFIERYKAVMFKPKMKLGIYNILNYLKKKNCSQLVLSAQEQNLLNLSILHYSLGDYFEGVFGLDNNFAASKTTLARSCLSPFIRNKQKIVFIGDTVHDFEVASSVGASCCLVSWGHNSSRRLSETKQLVVKNTSGLFAFFKKTLQAVN